MYGQKTVSYIVMLGLVLGLTTPLHAASRNQIQIVGSSTVFPFATVVAERFGRAHRRDKSIKTPVIEATGTGGGFKLFCAGVGAPHPDITNASRRIKSREFDNCARQNISMSEFIIGYDGIVLANARGAAVFSLTLRDIFLALAARVPAPKQACTAQKCALVKNPYRYWNEINEQLPRQKIEVLGPPPTSGTRDAFVELAMEGGAKNFPYYMTLKSRDKKAYKAATHTLREDGRWIDAGENDNLMVAKLVANPKALGVFGFSFLDQNIEKIKPAPVDNIMPDFAAIATGDYKISRSLYVYVKREHIGIIPGIKQFMESFVSETMVGEDGYLIDKGLIPLKSPLRDAARRAVKKMLALKRSDIQ